MIKVVLDTNILVSSILSEYGFSHKIVELAIKCNIKNHVSIDILKEFQKVLTEYFEQPDEYVTKQIALVKSYSELVCPKENKHCQRRPKRQHYIGMRNCLQSGLHNNW